MLQRIRLIAVQVVRGLRRGGMALWLSVMSLGLALAATSLSAQILDSLIFRMPGGIANPETVVKLFLLPEPPGHRTTQASLALFDGLRSAAGEFRVVAAYRRETRILGRGDASRQVDVGFASAAYFEVLSLQSAHGRFFTALEAEGPGPSTAIIGHRLWRDVFQLSPDVLGQSIIVGGTAYTVIGVAGEDFRGVDHNAPLDLWLPLAAAAAFPQAQPFASESYFVSIIGRVSGPNLRRAQAQAREVVRRQAEISFEPPAEVILGPLSGPMSLGPEWNSTIEAVRRIRTASLFLIALVSANLANLSLLRVVRLKDEYAILSALGASRLHLMGRTICEVGIIALIAAGLGFLGIVGASATAPAFATPALIDALGDTGKHTLMTLMIVAGCVWAISATPAVLWLTRELRPVKGRGQTSQWPLVRRIVVAIQCAVSVLLLVGAALFGSSFRSLTRIDLGIETENLLLVKGEFDVALSRAGMLALHEEWAQNVSPIRGVATVAVASGVPFGPNWMVAVRLPQTVWSGMDPVALGRAVDANYFEAAGLRSLRGRLLTADEVGRGAKAVVINNAFARRYWGDTDPVGSCLTLGDEHVCSTVVGVVADTPDWSILSERKDEVYVPLVRNGFGPSVAFGLLVRTNPQDPAVESEVRSVVQRSSGVRYAAVQAMGSFVASQTRPWLLAAVIFGAFEVIAGAVYLIGLYGLLTYSVEQDSRSIGIHMALGASPAAIRRRFVLQAMNTCIAGSVVGIGLAALAAPGFSALVVGVSARDPLIFLGASASTIASGMLVAYFPARRASRTSCAALFRSA